MAKLIITVKAGNGRRKDIEYDIADEVASDPVKRASAISARSAEQLNRVVNWKIKD